MTSGYEAKAGVFFATIDKDLSHKGITAFLIPFDTPGVMLGRKEDKLGIRATSTCDIVLQDVRVPKNYVLGKVGSGFEIAMHQLQLARIGVAAQALGIGASHTDYNVCNDSTSYYVIFSNTFYRYWTSRARFGRYLCIKTGTVRKAFNRHATDQSKHYGDINREKRN